MIWSESVNQLPDYCKSWKCETNFSTTTCTVGFCCLVCRCGGWLLLLGGVSARKHGKRNQKDKKSKFHLILVKYHISTQRYYKPVRMLHPLEKNESATGSTFVPWGNMIGMKNVNTQPLHKRGWKGMHLLIRCGSFIVRSSKKTLPRANASTQRTEEALTPKRYPTRQLHLSFLWRSIQHVSTSLSRHQVAR